LPAFTCLLSRHASTLARSSAPTIAATRLSACVPLSAIPQASIRPFAAAAAGAAAKAAPAAGASAPKCPDNYKDPKYEKYVKVPEGKKMVILGFGAIGAGVLPLLFRHIDMQPGQLIVVSDQYSEKQKAHAASYGVQLFTAKLLKSDYKAALEQHLQAGDFLVNLCVDVSSCALIEFCQAKDVLYMDTCNEPWAGGYSDPNVSAAERTNYAFRSVAAHRTANMHRTHARRAAGFRRPVPPPLERMIVMQPRLLLLSVYCVPFHVHLELTGVCGVSLCACSEEALEFRKQFAKDGPTALITHGANPGLVSHFVKQGLLDIARDTGFQHAVPRSRAEWAQLAKDLDIKTIHISERDTQASASVIKHDQVSSARHWICKRSESRSGVVQLADTTRLLSLSCVLFLPILARAGVCEHVVD